MKYLYHHPEKGRPTPAWAGILSVLQRYLPSRRCYPRQLPFNTSLLHVGSIPLHQQSYRIVYLITATSPSLLRSFLHRAQSRGFQHECKYGLGLRKGRQRPLPKSMCCDKGGDWCRACLAWDLCIALHPLLSLTELT